MKKSILTVAVTGLVLAGMVMAQPGHGSFGRFGHRPGMNKHHADGAPFMHKSWDDILQKRKQLNLSDEQVSKIKNMSYEFKTAQVDRRANIEKAQIELRRLKTDDQASKEAVMKAIDNLAMAKAEMDKARYSFRVEFQSVLTDEQKQKLGEMKKDSRRKFKGKFNFNGPQWRGQFDRWRGFGGGREI